MSDQLFEADYLQTGEAPEEDYLFHTKEGLITFVVIEEEMAQLNDYCVLCLNSVTTKLQDIEKEVADFESGQRKIVDPEFGDITRDYLFYIKDSEVLRWEDTQEFLVRAMCLLLLSAFTEKSIRSICDDLAPEGNAPPKIIRGIGKIESYLRYLMENCSLSFTEEDHGGDIRERCRSIRNSFAHGEWEEVRMGIAEISLVDAFKSTSKLIEAIEIAEIAKESHQAG